MNLSRKITIRHAGAVGKISIHAIAVEAECAANLRIDDLGAFNDVADCVSSGVSLKTVEGLQEHAWAVADDDQTLRLILALLFAQYTGISGGNFLLNPDRMPNMRGVETPDMTPLEWEFVCEAFNDIVRADARR